MFYTVLLFLTFYSFGKNMKNFVKTNYKKSRGKTEKV